MAFKEGVVYAYNSNAQGQIQVGTLNGPWVKTDDPRSGYSQILIQGGITNSTGTTQVFIDRGFDGVTNVDSSGDIAGSLAAGVTQNCAYPFFRVRIVQATAATSSAVIAVKASD